MPGGQERQTHMQNRCLLLEEPPAGPARMELAQCAQGATRWLAGFLSEWCHIGGQARSPPLPCWTFCGGSRSIRFDNGGPCYPTHAYLHFCPHGDFIRQHWGGPWQRLRGVEAGLFCLLGHSGPLLLWLLSGATLPVYTACASRLCLRAPCLRATFFFFPFKIVTEWPGHLSRLTSPYVTSVCFSFHTRSTANFKATFSEGGVRPASVSGLRSQAELAHP